MTAVIFPDYADKRGKLVGKSLNLNGMKLALVALPPGPKPDHADLELHFYNDLYLDLIQNEITANPARTGQIFRVRGGTRVLAGPAAGQVKVTGDGPWLAATGVAVRPVGAAGGVAS